MTATTTTTTNTETTFEDLLAWVDSLPQDLGKEKGFSLKTLQDRTADVDHVTYHDHSPFEN